MYLVINMLLVLNWLENKGREHKIPNRKQLNINHLLAAQTTRVMAAHGIAKADCVSCDQAYVGMLNIINIMLTDHKKLVC